MPHDRPHDKPVLCDVCCTANRYEARVSEALTRAEMAEARVRELEAANAELGRLAAQWQHDRGVARDEAARYQEALEQINITGISGPWAQQIARRALTGDGSPSRPATAAEQKQKQEG